MEKAKQVEGLNDDRAGKEEEGVGCSNMDDDAETELRVYEDVHQYLSHGEYPTGASKVEKAIIRKRAKKFQLVDGVLHYKEFSKADNSLKQRQVITDKTMRANILEACHNDRVAGCHFGRDKTAGKISECYYWKRIFTDAKDWVRRCEVCQRTKQKFDKPAPSLNPIPVTDTWSKVGIDRIELPISRSGNRYVITLTDYYSKWAEAAPIPTKEACHIAHFLYKTMLQYGCPGEICQTRVMSFVTRWSISWSS